MSETSPPVFGFRVDFFFFFLDLCFILLMEMEGADECSRSKVDEIVISSLEDSERTQAPHFVSLLKATHAVAPPVFHRVLSLVTIFVFDPL